MNLLQLKRNHVLHKQIYVLNYLLDGFYHISWANAIDYTLSNDKLIELNNNYLILLSLPSKQFNFILDLTILSLLFTDKSLKIRGKHLVYLTNKYGKNRVNFASIQANLSLEHLNIGVNNIVQSDAFYTQSKKYLAEKLYSNKATALKNRLAYKFDKELKIESQINNFWQSISQNSIERIIMFIAKTKFPHFFK